VSRKIFVAASYAFAVHGVAQPDAGAVQAEMRCDRTEAPGRVRCEVEARVAPGQTIAAGDVVIIRTPSFVTALRGRIGPHDATTREPEVWRWALALAAKEKGTGDVEAKVRIVVCHAAICAPRVAAVTARVLVGD
jgi:hypothetical protein